jgi:hypothetical protein
MWCPSLNGLRPDSFACFTFIDFLVDPHFTRRIPPIHFDFVNESPLVIAWSKNGSTTLDAILIAIALNLVVFVSMENHAYPLIEICCCVLGSVETKRAERILGPGRKDVR